jgi:hypothetical protein
MGSGEPAGGHLDVNPGRERCFRTVIARASFGHGSRFGLLRWTAISSVQARRKARGTLPSAIEWIVWQQLDRFIQEANIGSAELAEAAAEFEMDEDRRGEHEGE